MGDLQKPREKPATPGEYIERGPRGGEVPKPRQVALRPNNPKLPPISEEGHTWERIGPLKP